MSKITSRTGLLLCLLINWGPSSLFAQAEAKQPMPNIILLMGDDHGWEEVGYNGHPYVKTPYLDEMAAAGLRLDNFYAQPSCSPTRGSVLTGRHPNRYGIFRPGYSIRPKEITLAHLLKGAGYATAHFGKWHVGPVKESSPTNPGSMGFEHWLSHDNFFEMDPVFSLNGGPPKQFLGESSEILIDEAIRYIEKRNQAGQPFLVVIWYGSPHEPYSGLEKDLALYRDLPSRYSDVKVSLTSNETGKRVKRPLRDVLIERYAEITAMDRSIGKLRNALDTLGLRENTVLWYCGDNGIPPSGLRESRLRGVKGKVYENGIRVPGVIEWPKGIPKPRVSTVNAVTSDILPTLCALAGAKSPDVPLDGIDLTPLLNGNMKERGEPIEFWSFPVDRAAEESAKPYIDPELQKGTTPLVKESRGLLTRNFRNYHHPRITEDDFKGARAILTDDYKLVIDGDKSTGVELFDLKKDLRETNNLAEKHPKIVQQLSRQLRNWQEGVMNSLMGGDYAPKAAFEKAAAGAAWAEVFSDGCTEDWKAKWFLDGEVGSVTNSPEGMTLAAGPEFKNDAHHMVLWTKDSFEGDLKIEYEYTRLDEAPNCVTILYIQATGSGEGPYAKDITKWSELRKVPAMKTYYNHMNTYHISYAVGGAKYIRGRRYIPEKQGLKGTELKPDYFAPELFATGVKHRITVIKKDRALYMRIKNPNQVVYCHMMNPDLPVIAEGRIGLRHMFTRSARYANFRVSRPVPGGEAGAEPKIGKLASGPGTRRAESAPLVSAAAPSSGLSDAEIDRLWQNAAARCRAAFESESGKPFAPREIKKDWNNRGDFTRHYIQDVILFATRALTLNEQIDEANLALREMCQYHLGRPKTLLEIHSFPVAPRFLARLSLLYGPKGSRTKGLISEETHAVILKTLWQWCQSKLKIADTAIEPWHTWTAHSSENHHANHFASCWAATLLLSREPAYRDRQIADSRTTSQHYAAWTAWVTEYLRQRGRKGMTVEIDSSSYSKATLAAIYLIHDLTEDPELRQLASHYMTLAWALWAEQQINGVNGGAKTRCYAETTEASENPLSAAAWYVLGSDDHPKPKRPPAATFLTSTWKMPAVVMDIAFDVSGRGSYEVIQRRPGLRPADDKRKFKIHLAPDAPALVRYTYATPDFIMGSLFCDALPSEAWNNISSQNRWHGAIFAGDRSARIYPFLETKKSHYNAQWAIQKRGTLIAQKLRNNRHAKQHRVWFSREGLSKPIQEGAWYFAEADSAYAAVRVVSGKAAFEKESTDKRARILTCANHMSPVILEVARKADFSDFKAFRDAVKALPFQFDGIVLAYTGLGKDRFKFFANQSKRPQINGTPIDLGPKKVYDSPFLKSEYDSGVVTISKGKRKRILDFNK